MKGKLIKMAEGWTLSLTGNIDDLYAISNHQLAEDHRLYKLSIENCQAIEKGYDFDEYREGVFYAGQFGHPSPEGFSDEQIGRLHGFIDGFQKALSIIGNKKYSEDDIIIAMTCMQGQELFYEKTYEETRKSREIYIKNYIKSLQQNEWDVIVEMEEAYDGLDEKAQPQCPKRPKLDDDGCLYLSKPKPL